MEPAPKSPWSLKALLFAGLAAILPTLLILLVVSKGFDLVHDFGGARVAVLLFDHTHPPVHLRLLADLLALILFVLLTAGAGLLVRQVFGRQILDFLEHSLLKIPLVKRIYPALRQLTDFLVSDKRPAEFQRVVAIPYPHPGVYSVGFVTGEDLPEFRATGKRLLTVFLPSSPMPLTGWICLVPAEQAVPLQMSVEEALRFFVSAGVSRSPSGIQTP